MTENEAVKYVQQNARYFAHGFPLPSGKKGGKYAVEYRGTLHHSNCTRRLVRKLLK